MKKLFFGLFLMLTAISTAIPGVVFAAAQDKPLIIIRFDNNLGSYEQSLNKAVKMALKIKQETYFDIVAIAPEVADAKKMATIEKDTRALAEEVKDQIKDAGAAEEMVRITYQTNKTVSVKEIQVFVQ